MSMIPLLKGCHLDQILEFRKDRTAQTKLRRLQLFFHENYVRRSKDFIEDDLAVRIADYEDTAKQLGFQTAEASVTALQGSSLVRGGFAIAAIATLLHEPVTAVVSAVTPVVLNISGAALKLHRERRDLRRVLERNPVSYISMAADKLTARR